LKQTDAVADYLNKVDASATYLKQTDAVADYLNKVDASATYLKQTDAVADYLNKVDASATYLKQTDAVADYLNKVDASATYLKQTDAVADYLNKVDASATYLKQTDAVADYLNKVDASATYLKLVDASNTYLRTSGGNVSDLIITNKMHIASVSYISSSSSLSFPLEEFYCVNGSSAAYTITLPSLLSSSLGAKFIFKYVAGSNDVTLQGSTNILDNSGSTVSNITLNSSDRTITLVVMDTNGAGSYNYVQI
jgi:hypothetical protein